MAKKTMKKEQPLRFFVRILHRAEIFLTVLDFANMEQLFQLLFILDCNASKVKWDHGINSKESLAESVKNTSKISMIESDVIVDQTETELIMAHPPLTTSDLTFDFWLETVDRNSNLGGKADFKSMEAARKIYEYGFLQSLIDGTGISKEMHGCTFLCRHMLIRKSDTVIHQITPFQGKQEDLWYVHYVLGLMPLKRFCTSSKRTKDRFNGCCECELSFSRLAARDVV
uniref:Menorin-like domain-containing protein n=1 Tax=Romanomermis culicivorax TaxID=13658 RepID=A0A915JAZ2_ROMCU